MCACECVAGDKHRRHHRQYLDAKSWPAGAQFLSIPLFQSSSSRPFGLQASELPRQGQENKCELHTLADSDSDLPGRVRASLGRQLHVSTVDAQWTLSGRSVDAAVDAQWTLSFYEVFCARDEK